LKFLADIYGMLTAIIFLGKDTNPFPFFVFQTDNN